MTVASCKLCKSYRDVDLFGHCETCAELNPSRNDHRWTWLDWVVAAVVVVGTLYFLLRSIR